MKRCSRCVMVDTRPDTEFVGGLCSACISHDARQGIDWTSRRSKLEQILEDLPYVDGFNCIVPSSGGKDSCYQVQTLLEMGASPLIVTATTCYLTEVGRRNIDNLARYATTIEYTTNRDTRAKLNRIGLEMVGDISWPEHTSIFTTPFRIAQKMGIKAIFYGENPVREYGGPLSVVDQSQMTKRWVSEFGGFLGLRPQDLQGHIEPRHLKDYMLPEGELDVVAYFLGQFIQWDSRRNADVAGKMGMVCKYPTPMAWWNFENQDNAMTGIHDFFGYLKYGYNRASAQISVDIRNGLITREEGLKEAQIRDGFFPIEYMGVSFRKVLERIGMDEDKFFRVMDEYTNWEIFRRVVDDQRALPMLIA